MDVETVRKHIGKKVLLILRNNFQYTTIIPDFKGTEFEITDKFGKEASVSCEFISFIIPVGDKNG